jgi:hypothetical protein
MFAPALSPVFIYLGYGAIAIVSIFAAAKKSKVSPKMKKKIEQERSLIENLKDNEPREPTPATHQNLFDHVSSTFNPKKTKLHKKKSNGEYWAEDWTHLNEFEVFSNQKKLEKGERNRVVTWDGRRR